MDGGRTAGKPGFWAGGIFSSVGLSQVLQNLRSDLCGIFASGASA